MIPSFDQPAQPGAHQHQRGIPVRETADYPQSASDLPIQAYRAANSSSAIHNASVSSRPSEAIRAARSNSGSQLAGDLLRFRRVDSFEHQSSLPESLHILEKWTTQLASRRPDSIYRAFMSPRFLSEVNSRTTVLSQSSRLPHRASVISSTLRTEAPARYIPRTLSSQSFPCRRVSLDDGRFKGNMA